MVPLLRQRLTWKPAGDRDGQEPMAGSAAKARALAYMFATGGVLGATVVALPQLPQSEELGMLLTSASAFAVAVVVLAAFERIPAWGFPALLACGTLLIGAEIYFSGDASSAYAVLYLWVYLYAFYFLPRNQALVQALLVAACYAAVLALRDPTSTSITRWVITIATLTAAGLLVGRLRDRVGMLIERLGEAAVTDPLTGLPNRRGFEQAMRLELERAGRSRQPLSLILGDIDCFKQVNDKHGHQQGDSVLKRLGAILERSKRRADVAARIGGEEFAVVAADTDEPGAYMLAERLRTEVERSFSEQTASVTISFGIASFPGHGESLDDLSRAADEALYAAKSLGRNRSVIHSRETAGILSQAAGLRERESRVELATVLAIAEALDLRGGARSADHSETVGRWAELLAEELGLPGEGVARLRLAGVVHDIGTIGVAEKTICKPGPLSEREWPEVRSHPEVGARILRNARLTDLSGWVLAHHERPDGRGYPNGLRQGEIPLEASILAVADAYEAMTAERPFRPALPGEAVLVELERGAGEQFEERVVGALIGLLARELPARSAA